MQSGLTKIVSVACILVREGGRSASRFSIGVVLLIVGIPIVGGICWQILDSWVKRTRGRKWPTVSAAVDLVSVALMNENTLHFKAYSSICYYLATLTYSYYSTDKQMGDYSRRFANEDDARAWANSYKGETIKVHVDPRDPTRSVIREEDL
jgi:hypothetical protein